MLRILSLTPFLIASFYFFHFAFVGIMLIYLPKILLEGGFSSIEIGIVFSIMPFVRFLMPLLFVKILSINRETILFLSVMFFIATCSLYFSVDHFYLLIITQILIGVAISLLVPFVETIALSELGKEKYGKIRLYGSLGFIISALYFADMIAQKSFIIYSLIFFAFLTSFFVIKILEKSKNNIDLFNSDNKDFSLKSHKYLWMNIFLMQVSFGAFYNFFTIYETEHGIGIDIVSYLWTFGVVCEILMLYFQTPLLKRFDLVFLIAISTSITSLRWLLLFLFPDSLGILFFTQSLHALGFALYHTATITYLYQVYKEKNLAQQFYAGISYGLGLFVGSIFSGAFYGEYIFLYSFMMAFLAFIVLFFEKKRFYNNKLTAI